MKMKGMHWWWLGIPAAVAGWWLTPGPVSVFTREPAGAQQGAITPQPATDAELTGRLAAVRGAKGRWGAVRAAVALARSIPADQQLQWLRSDRFHHADLVVKQAFVAELGRLAFNENPSVFIAADLKSYRPEYEPYLAEMAKRDPLAVAELARTMENASVRNICLNAAVVNLAESQPDELFRVVREMPEPDKSLVRYLVKAARGDSGRLLTLAEECGDQARLLMRQAAVALMCDKDLRGTVRWIDEQEDANHLINGLLWWPGDRIAFNKRLAELIPELPDGWLNRADPDGMSGYSNRLISMFSIGAEEAWLEADVKRLGIDDDSIRYNNREMVGKLGLRNPDAAARYFMDESIVAPKDRPYIARIWACQASNSRVKLPAALDAVLDDASRAMADAYLNPKTQAAKPSPSVADRLNEACEDSYYGFLVDGIEDWKDAQFAEAKAWADSLPDERIERVTKHVATGTGMPPEIHDQIVARAIKLGAMSEKTVCRWLGQVSSEACADPAAVARRMIAYPESKERSLAIQNVALRWNELAPDEVVRWIASLKDADRETVRDALKRAESWKPDPD